jgi:hypothetical protein
MIAARLMPTTRSLSNESLPDAVDLPQNFQDQKSLCNKLIVAVESTPVSQQIPTSSV